MHLTSSIRTAILIATLGSARIAAADVASQSPQAHAPAANHVAAFLGATHAEEETHFTAGLEHEYRLPTLGGLLGVGPVLEYVRADHNVGIGILLVHAHPWRGVNLFAGPGYERASGHGETLLRAGASYDVHVASASLSPTVAVDRIAGHTAVVGGAAVGFGF